MNQPLDTNEDDGKKSENKREGFKANFRRRIFQIYFELMKERNIDSIFASVMLLICFIQIFGLLYNTKVNFPFRDDLFSTISKICDIVRIYPLVEQAGGIYYWVLGYFLIVFMVAYILQLIFIDYSIKIEKFYFIFPIKLLRHQSSFIQWILIQPIVEQFISIFSCTNGHHSVDSSLICWTGMHIFYCILFSLCLIIYIFIFILISFFYNESRPYNTDALARLDTNFETLLVLYRILICIVGHFLYSPNLHWLIIAIHVLGSINFCKMYLKYLPYYNSQTSTLFGSGWFAYFWISLNVLLTKALESVQYEGQSIVILIGLALIYPATKQIRDLKIQKKIFNKKHDKIKSEYELDIFIHKLYRLIIDQNVNQVDEMVLLGIVHNHQSECLNNECPLNSNEELYLPLTDSISDRTATQYSKDPILLFHLINSIYAEYAKSSNSTVVLHTTYAYFLFYQIGNIHTALLELNVAEKCDSSFQQKFTIYRAKRFIENYLVNKFGKSKDNTGKQTFHDLDVTIVIIFENLFAKLNKEIEKSANDHIEFWTHLDSQMVDLNVLHKLGLNIINNTKKINEIWNQLSRINPNYPKALQIYGNYLVQIKNDNSEGEDYLNQANMYARPKSEDGHFNDFELMFAEDTAIVVISGNKDSQAKIMKTNNGITKLFGYNTFEVHGHEVNILMPPIIGVKHNYFLEQFFKTGRERVINNDLDSFAMLRTGQIFSITLIVKPVPSLKNDIQYIGLIKPKNRDYDFILTDQYGKIDSISKGISSMLSLQASFFKENEIYIQVLCPLLCEVERVKGTREQKTKFEVWNGVKDLTFIIPRNFSSLQQKAGNRGAQAINNNQGENEYGEDKGGPGQNFVGLKGPDNLKKVCNMFKNNEFKTQPHKYLQTLKSNINYDNPEIHKGPIKTDIIHKSHGNGHLQMRVFKILNPKKAGTNDDSDSERGNQAFQVNKNIKQMIEEANKKLANQEMTSDDLLRRILVMKQTLAQIKKGQRHPAIKNKGSIIATAHVYEKAEIQKYEKDIKELHAKIPEIQKQEEEKMKNSVMEDSRDEEDYQSKRFKKGEKQQDSDFLIQDPSLLQNRTGYNDASQNDVSAFQDDSLLHEKGLLANRGADDMTLNDYSQINDSRMGENEMSIKNKNGLDYSEVQEDDQYEKPRHKDQDNINLNIFKDIKKTQQKDSNKKKKKEDSPDKKEGKDGEKGEENGESGGETTKEGTDEAEDEKFLEEDTGSVASSTKSLMKHLRMLRNALYENYSPPSIRNLRYQARLVFIVLLIITIIWYVYSKSIYNQLKDNIVNIHSSKARMNSITDIGADVRILEFMNQGNVDLTKRPDYMEYKKERLNNSAKILQESQNNLSETYLRKVFTEENKELINPSLITLFYEVPCNIDQFYYVNIWSALMTLSVHAYHIFDMPLTQITKDDTSVFFVLFNTFNNILQSVEFSTQAILDETEKISGSVKKTIQILLYVASGSLLVSVCFIFPVATKVDKNKDELLRHFMLIDREDVKAQLDKCRNFFNTMHDKADISNNSMNDIDDDEEDKDDKEEGKEDEDGKEDSMFKQKKGRQRSRKNKMHKKFSTNFLSLILKFLFVVTILEGYFLICFFQSGNFLKVANNLINESGTITLRHFSNNFLYEVMQEVLTTNATAQIKNQDSLEFIFDYLNKTIKDQEQFLKTHSNNQEQHSQEFNTFFDDLIYNDVCSALYQETTAVNSSFTDCQDFMGGILKKGLYSANVAYWDHMRSMITDFNNSVRDDAAIYEIINSDRLINNEELKDTYFETAYQELLDQLDKSILKSFSDKDQLDTILFAVYIVILFILYFVGWDRFLESTKYSLWVTKSMLAIIPLDIIQKVQKIKDFLLASSKNTMSAFKD